MALLLNICCVYSSHSFGQTEPGNSVIVGIVSDAESGEILTGASVSIKGTTNGTITGIDGKYSITVESSNQATLVFSYIGYQTVEMKIGDRRVIDVSMRENMNQIEEVVVTALGITRETKSIGYSVQKIEGKTLLESRETNLLNALSNRVAGVQITNSSGGVGASSNIQIRGQNFVTGYNYNNSPLFVVDGIPISNNNEQSTRSFTGRQDFNNPNFTGGEGEVDYGNAAGEIDPNDIETLTVLKGPNAAALYGARASNGVILITTKSGKNAKGTGVTYNSSFSMETPLKLPEYQYEYGQGRNGQYAYTDGKGGGTNDNVIENWGPRMDGRLLPQWDSPIDPKTGERIPTPFIAYPNQLKDFFKTGHTFTNNIAVEGKDEKLNFHLSFTNMSQAGIVPNTDLARNDISLRAGYALKPNLRIDAAINYINSGSNNRASYGAKNEDAIMKIFLYMPRNVDVRKLKDYWKEGSGNLVQNSPIWSENGSRLNNPYFVAYENLNGNNRDRVFGNIKLTYDILPNLRLLLRSGRDMYYDKRTMRHAVSSAQYLNGYYQVDDVSYLETNHDFLLSYSTPLGEQFAVSASAGGNMMRQVSQRLGSIVEKLAIPNVYNITNNATPVKSGNTYQEKRINSLYGTAQFSYRNAVFLDVTGRNDWSSALPVKNNSYFYPSVSLSSVLSEFINMNRKQANFLKVRGSISSVRRDLEPYQTSANFQISQGWAGETSATHNNNYPNSDIRPEKVVSYEFGFDSRFFNNRLGLDVTYYKSITTDLIIPVTLNPSAGYDTKLMNVGKLSNRGLEIMLNLTPVAAKNFTWMLNINYAMNRNKVHYLAESIGVSRIRQLERWASLEMRTENTKGDGSYGSLYGDYLIYKNGQLTHRNGFPQEENGDWGYQGNINPDWTGGIGNEFRYRHFSLSCLVGIRMGGVVYSRTFIEGIRAGSLKESLPNRGADGNGTIIGGGVDIDTGEPNSIKVTARDYWRAYYDNDVIGTFDASYIKLRELKLTYNLPVSLLKHTPLSAASVSLTGRNLFLMSKAPNIDPEVSSYDGQYQGVETMSLPSLRSYGLSINIRF